MKRRILMLATMLFFFLMLLFPKPVFDGASDGLLLWFQIVLPTLLPFIILSNLLLSTHAIDIIARLIYPVFSRVFHVSAYGSFALLTGFLCGYPMGGKVTADLIKNGSITVEEGRYLLSFCNNSSPMFIISFVVLQNLKEESYKVPALLILMGTPVLLSFLFRRFTPPLSKEASGIRGRAPFKSPAGEQRHYPGGSSLPLSGGLIDTCIMNGFETITKVGGYIMLFSIALSLAGLLPLHSPILKLLVLPSLEITNGIALICGSGADPDLRFILSMALTSFGGFCAAAQTKCMIQGTGLRILPHIAEKLVTALVTSLFAYIYVSL